MGPIIRRFFVMNAFDGSLTTLGLIIGAWISKGGFFNLPLSLFFYPKDIVLVVVVGLTTSVSMGVSGLWGSYLTEAAESKKEVQHLERAMAVEKGAFKDSVLIRAQRFSNILAAIVDGGSPAMAGLICLLPFFLSLVLPLQYVAFLASMMTTYAMLSLLGIFLGKISKKSLLFSALKMLFAGVLITLLFIFLPF